MTGTANRILAISHTLPRQSPTAEEKTGSFFFSDRLVNKRGRLCPGYRSFVRGRKRCQEPFRLVRTRADTIFIEARISRSWLEGHGIIFKKDRRRPQLCTGRRKGGRESLLERLVLARGKLCPGYR